MRRILLNLFVLCLVSLPTLLVYGIFISSWDSLNKTNAQQVDNKKVFLGVTDVALTERAPPFNRSVELYWIKADSPVQAKKYLARALDLQESLRIYEYSIVEVLSKDSWAGGGHRFIDADKNTYDKQASYHHE